MVEKIYHLRINRNMENEILYIKDVYSPISCGGLTAKLLKVKVDLPDENAFIEDMTQRGVESLYIDNQFVDLSTYQKSAKDNRVIFQINQTVTLNSLGNSYIDVFSNYNGKPIPLDTTGYKKMGMVLMWNKNGGGGIHTIKLTQCNTSGTINNPENILRETAVGAGGYITDFNYTIPEEFLDFKGFVKLQAKSSISNNPIFDALWLYMIRR